LEYDETTLRYAVPDADQIKGPLHVRSPQALERLKALVERIILAEVAGLPPPETA
jgi:hypothetical protein